MEKKDIRIVFMGTPAFAVETLKQLVENEYNVVGVVTQPDKPVGRHQDTLQPPAIKQYALSMGLPVLQPEKMKDANFIEQLAAWQADLFVVVAFRMLPEVVWSMPRFGTFNVHAALLPQYRGAAPINWAIINGETETGVTTFFLDKDIDTGRIISQLCFPIPDDADAEYVYDGLMMLGANLAQKTIDLIASNVSINTTKAQFAEILQRISKVQEADVQALKHAPKIFKETCEIDWHIPAKAVHNFVRGLSPYPGVWSIMKKKDAHDAKDTTLTLKIFRTQKTNRQSMGEAGTFHTEKGHLYVNTKDELIELLEVQLSGKKRMEATVFLNGFKQLDAYELLNKDQR